MTKTDPIGIPPDARPLLASSIAAAIKGSCLLIVCALTRFAEQGQQKNRIREISATSLLYPFQGPIRSQQSQIFHRLFWPVDSLVKLPALICNSLVLSRFVLPLTVRPGHTLGSKLRQYRKIMDVDQRFAFEGGKARETIDESCRHIVNIGYKAKCAWGCIQAGHQMCTRRDWKRFSTTHGILGISIQQFYEKLPLYGIRIIYRSGFYSYQDLAREKTN